MLSDTPYRARVLKTVNATAYLTPLREGGSLPGLVEAEDEGMYVVKFTGAGQGTAALSAEIVTARIASAIGLRVPELVLVNVDPAIAPREPDQEVQDLLRSSAGLNLGVDFLPRALGYDGIAWRPESTEAATVLWLDALVGNVDRSWRNPNLLVWHRALWLIDHGATLTFAHSWPDVSGWAQRNYDDKDHALGFGRTGLVSAHERCTELVTSDVLAAAIEDVPETWLSRPRDGRDARIAYFEYLSARLDRAVWLDAAAA